jgi:hypothetical protein
MASVRLSAEAGQNIRMLADVHYARQRIHESRPDLDTFSPMGQLAVMSEIGRMREKEEDRSQLRATLMAAPLEEHEQIINQWQTGRVQGEQ